MLGIRHLFSRIVHHARGILRHVTDYATNCSIAGINYIADVKLYFIERVFWLGCVISCAVGAYLVITEYERNFENSVVSIVYESLPPNHRVSFPSIAVCYRFFDSTHDLIMQYTEKIDSENENLDLEAFLANLIFPNGHTNLIVASSCDKHVNKTLHCPTSGYRELTEELLFSCEVFFSNCTFQNKPFECCRYFLPFMTSYGKCFLLNSLLNNKPGSASWLDLTLDPSLRQDEITINTTQPRDLFVVNNGEVPIVGFPSISSQMANGGMRTLSIAVEEMINDEYVHDISPAARKCRFPEEILPSYRYPIYSFSTCYAECVRSWQIKFCNCSLYNYMPKEDASIPDCGYEGMVCIEGHRLVQPDPARMLPWADSTPCNCLPSCTENDFRVLQDGLIKYGKSVKIYGTKVLIPYLPTHRYRRQALRTQLDVVVTIGGILGLFLGVSILSGIEFIYYFTVRICGDRWQRRRRPISPKMERF